MIAYYLFRDRGVVQLWPFEIVTSSNWPCKLYIIGLLIGANITIITYNNNIGANITIIMKFSLISI